MELVEHGSGVALDLSPQDIIAVAETSAFWRKRLKLREEPFQLGATPTGQYLLQARGVAGFVKIGGISLEISPKFLGEASLGPEWRSAMWRFLAYGHGITALSDTSGSASKHGGVADIMADLFLNSLRGAAARGYPVGYRTTAFSSPFLRGRLDSRHYKSLLPPTGMLGVIAPKLTPDIPTNRLLKWAGLELSKLVEDPERRRRLIAWAGDLGDVSPRVPALGSVPSPRRHHPYLVHAVELAKLLLDDRRPGFEIGELILPGFLWDSEDLFERAIRRLLDESCRSLGLYARKERHNLASRSDEAETFTQTTPDISILKGSNPIIIADAKYKAPKSDPHNADFYQVLAGGRVTGVETVALIYPQAGTEIACKRYAPVGVGNPREVQMVSIGLGSFASRAGIKELRTKVRAWVVSATQPKPQSDPHLATCNSQ